ncbi:MAG: aminotransferase class III-fold pyridoxal phosphate-dependent enzyme [Cyclobacteriaceae bacterium]
MKNFDVYPLFEVTPVKGSGTYVYDENEVQYLDFYGGHAVISIGHNHPHYVTSLENQLHKIGFYSNSVQNPLQVSLAEKLGHLSDYENYNIFLVNSGAEAIENAIKLSGFHNRRSKVIVFERGFHGRTSMAVQATDNPRIRTSLDDNKRILRLPLNDEKRFISAINEEVSCVIVEGIQGVGGIQEPTGNFLRLLEEKCRENNSLLILDEIQSGYGRTGKFFAHQHADINPDLITIAKGMGNGFPIGGVLISPAIRPSIGMLGTTFGGNHLACAAGIAVLEVLEKENLIENARQVGELLKERLKEIPQVKEIRGKGLMLAADFDFPVKVLRQKLVYEQHLFTGASSVPETLRLLPPLTITSEEVDIFIEKLKAGLKTL